MACSVDTSTPDTEETICGTDCLTVDDLTTRDLEGSGVFDAIMEASRVRLDREFIKKRIQGPDYAKVYLGGMEAAMQQSVVFLLGKDKASNEAFLLQSQKKKIDAEISLLGKQEDKMDAEIALAEDQLLTQQKEREKTDKEIDLIVAKGLMPNSSDFFLDINTQHPAPVLRGELLPAVICGSLSIPLDTSFKFAMVSRFDPSLID